MHNRHSGVELIRALSLCLVYFFHMYPRVFYFGYIGVDIFIILSGYFAANQVSTLKSQKEFFAYIFKRFLRILPATIVFSSVVLLFLQLFGLPFELRAGIDSYIWILSGLANVYFWKQTGYFEFSENFEPFLHFWSTSVELQFFVFAAFVSVLARNFRISTFIIIFATGFLFFIYVVIFDLESRVGVYFLLPFRIWEFALGFFIFWVASHLEARGQECRISEYFGIFLLQFYFSASYPLTIMFLYHILVMSTFSRFSHALLVYFSQLLGVNPRI